MNTPTVPETPFALLGGDEARIERIVETFYDRMSEAEPALARLHETDERGFVAARARERFARFFIEWLGGPKRFSPTEGHPRLRMRHAHVPVDEGMRDAWLRAMSFALDQHQVEGDLRAFLDSRLADLADFLRNRH